MIGRIRDTGIGIGRDSDINRAPPGETEAFQDVAKPAQREKHN